LLLLLLLQGHRVLSRSAAAALLPTHENIHPTVHATYCCCCCCHPIHPTVLLLLRLLLAAQVEWRHQRQVGRGSSGSGSSSSSSSAG
jgi:hypothetical protein